MDFPSFPPQVIALEMVVGASVGACIGLVIDILLQRGKRGVFIDTMLGIIGFVGGAVGTAVIRFGENTQVYRVGGTVVRTTVRHYQYPYRVAFVMAVGLPALFEVIRTLWFRARPQTRVSDDGKTVRRL